MIAPRMVDFAAEGLLDGLEGSAREERLELLERLHADGYGLEDLRRADNVAMLPAESAVGGPPLYTAEEVSEQVGIEADLLLRLRRTSGLPVAGPGDRVFIQGDVDNARRIADFRKAGLSDEQMLEVSRVLGRGLGHAADVMRAVAMQMAVEPGATETEMAMRYAMVAEVLTPMTAPLLEHLMLLHLRHSVSNELVNAAERAEGGVAGARDVAVAFADLVGFTRLGEKVPPEELGRVAERLAAMTIDVIAAPVRLVKTIGDAVMLVATEPEPLVEATLDLVAAADEEGDDFPQLRAGVAAGPALRRAGDWFGRPVNLASRITGVARPGTVLATQELHDALPDAYRWSFAGARPLKGVGEVPLYRVRQLPPPDEQASEPPAPQDKRARRRRR
jgi:adenylate cyclase